MRSMWREGVNIVVETGEGSYATIGHPSLTIDDICLALEGITEQSIATCQRMKFPPDRPETTDRLLDGTQS